jgi:hypothetical protein
MFMAIIVKVAGVHQARGHRGAYADQLHELALLELGVGRDHATAQARHLVARGEELVGDRDVRPDDGGERRACRVEVREQRLAEVVGAEEEHLALVGEVAEEGPLGHAGALGDLGDGGAVVPALAEQREPGRGEAALRVRLPA